MSRDPCVPDEAPLWPASVERVRECHASDPATSSTKRNRGHRHRDRDGHPLPASRRSAGKAARGTAPWPRASACVVLVKKPARRQAQCSRRGSHSAVEPQEGAAGPTLRVDAAQHVHALERPVGGRRYGVCSSGSSARGPGTHMQPCGAAPPFIQARHAANSPLFPTAHTHLYNGGARVRSRWRGACARARAHTRNWHPRTPLDHARPSARGAWHGPVGGHEGLGGGGCVHHLHHAVQRVEPVDAQRRRVQRVRHHLHGRRPAGPPARPEVQKWRGT